MTVNEIFKTNPWLLNEPEVQNLIEYVQEQHKRTVGIVEMYQDFHDFVLDKIMYSELILIEGKSCKETLEEIQIKINSF